MSTPSKPLPSAGVAPRWYGLPPQSPREPPAGASPARRWTLRYWRGDLLGSIAATLSGIPLCIGFGLLALAPLGPDYAAYGILGGLYAAIVASVVALACGADTTIIYAPRSIATYLFSSLVALTFVQTNAEALTALAPTQVLTLVFLIVFLAGAFQLAFAAMRMGAVVKYVPLPVLAGFQNAAAILILSSQAGDLLGLPAGFHLHGVAQQLRNIQPLTLLVGTASVALMLGGARILPRVPPTALGILGGVALYHGLHRVLPDAALGPTIGTVQLVLPTPHYLAAFFELGQEPAYAAFLPLVVSSALSIAIVASFDALLCARIIETDSGNRIQPNGELMRVGLGNMAAALFGGIVSGISLAQSFANHRSGARTVLSVAVSSALMLVAVVATPQLLALVPKVVIAAALLVVAIQLVDRWTFKIVWHLLKHGRRVSGGAMTDLSIIVCVTFVAVAVNVALAVVLGVLITVVSFVYRMSRSIVRRALYGDDVHSRKRRDGRQADLLGLHGREIMVLELEGMLFFGTAENLLRRVEREARRGVSYAIVDLKRVTDVDSTGARVLIQLHDRLQRDGHCLLLSGLGGKTQLAAALAEQGVVAALSRGRLFDDTDRALEWAEDHLLLRRGDAPGTAAEFAIERLDLFQGLSSGQLAAIRPLLERSTCARGDIVVRVNTLDEELFIIAQGTASVYLTVGERARVRLMTFAPGTVFGELALLDREERSATVEADEDLVCYVLAQAGLEHLKAHQPAIAIKLLSNLGRELATRLRRANRTIHLLAD